MSKLTVNSKENCFVISEGFGAIESKAASMALEPGTYVIRIVSGGFSFGGSSGGFSDPEDPFVLLWFRGRFTNKATGVTTRVGWGCLNGYGDTYTVEIIHKTTLYALFMDSDLGNNRGKIELSILSDS